MIKKRVSFILPALIVPILSILLRPGSGQQILFDEANNCKLLTACNDCIGTEGCVWCTNHVRCLTSLLYLCS